MVWYAMGKRLVGIVCCICSLICLAGCTLADKSEKVRDLEYTVVKEDEIPEALRLQIEEKKAARFKLTYMDGSSLYIACGYGEQLTGGYSIAMKELYMTQQAVYFATELHGPGKGETVCKSPSYPYIVVKLEQIELPIVFE